MGDFSSTFSIVNNLDTDLVVSKNGSPRYGRWLRWPNDGKVELLSTSEQFQLKDEWGEFFRVKYAVMNLLPK